MGENFMKKQNEIRPFSFLMLTLSGIINAAGITLFLLPVNLFDSGFSGTSMFLSSITGISLGVFLLVLNIPFFIFGYKRQGIAFTVYSVYAVLVYSIASSVIQSAMPLSGASPFAGDDLLLCSVFGGLISGVGSGLTIRFGGAIDGVEVMSVIFAKKIGITVGTFVMIYNAVLYTIIGIISSSWTLPLYSVITYTIALKAVDYIVEGFDKAKSAMIITGKAEEICAELSEEFGRGITLINSRGYYHGEEKKIIYFVVNRFQIGRLRAIVAGIDPKAYITITEISDIFRSSSKKTGDKAQNENAK